MSSDSPVKKTAQPTANGHGSGRSGDGKLDTDTWWKYKVKTEENGRKRWENSWKFVLEEDIHRELWPQSRRQQSEKASSDSDKQQQPDLNPESAHFNRFSFRDKEKKEGLVPNSDLPRLEKKLFASAKRKPLPKDIALNE